MWFKYKFDFFIDHDVIGYDDFINDMYQSGWMYDDRILFITRFKRVENPNGYLHYLQFNKIDDTKNDENLKKHGFEKVSKKLYRGDSFTELENIQQEELIHYSSESFFGSIIALIFLSIVPIILVSFQGWIYIKSLFMFLSNTNGLAILFLFLTVAYGICTILMEWKYKKELSEAIKNGEILKKPNNNIILKVFLLMILFSEVCIIFLSFFVNYSLIICLIIIGIFLALGLYSIFAHSSIEMKAIEGIISIIIGFTVTGGIAGIIDVDYSLVCLRDEHCITRKSVLENTFYSLSIREVWSGVRFDYYEANSEFAKDLAMNYYIDEYTMQETKNSLIQADKVFSNDNGEYLIINGNRVMFIYSIPDDFEIEKINYILS